MTRQELNLDKKKRGRPAIGRGEQVNAMLRPDVVEAMDKAAADEIDSPSRPEMVRRILVDWLIGRRYLPNPPPKEDAN